MKLTRQHMIDAVKTEPLLKRRWITLKERYYNSVTESGANLLDVKFDDKNCPVCAVGATLRTMGIGDWRIDSIAVELTDSEHCPSINEWDELEWSGDNDYIAPEYSLIALSCFFEDGDWKTREDLVKWIEEYIDPELNEDVAL